MVRSLLSLGLVLALAPALAAQDKPTPAIEAALAGTWTFDQSHSDTVPSNPLLGGGGATMGGFPAARSGGGSGGGGGKGGGGKGGKGGGGGGGGADSVPHPAAPSGDNGASRYPGMQYVVGDMQPVPKMVITANDTSVTMTNAAGETVIWRTDGKKRQEALMEGGMLETQGQWDGAKLQLMHGVPGSNSLKREFAVSKDGKTLLVKETLDLGRTKMEKKLTYVRNP